MNHADNVDIESDFAFIHIICTFRMLKSLLFYQIQTAITHWLRSSLRFPNGLVSNGSGLQLSPSLRTSITLSVRKLCQTIVNIIEVFLFPVIQGSSVGLTTYICWYIQTGVKSNIFAVSLPGSYALDYSHFIPEIKRV